MSHAFQSHSTSLQRTLKFRILHTLIPLFLLTAYGTYQAGVPEDESLSAKPLHRSLSQSVGSKAPDKKGAHEAPMSPAVPAVGLLFFAQHNFNSYFFHSSSAEVIHDKSPPPYTLVSQNAAA